MPRHHITTADVLTIGNGKHPRGSGSNSGRGVPFRPTLMVDLGTPAVGAANTHFTSASIAAATPIVTGAFTGALAGVNDVPRNIVAAWTNTAVMTVRGLDTYGRAMTESSGSGTSFTGKKAFKSITSVSVSADVTSATVGTGDVLGLPHPLAGGWDLIGFYADGTRETAMTVVGADTTTATATTGDVRGTIDPNTTLNGTVRFRAWMAVSNLATDAGCYGGPQFAG